MLPAYLGAADSIAPALAGLLEADDFVHEVTGGSVLTSADRAACHEAIQAAAAGVRAARVLRDRGPQPLADSCGRRLPRETAQRALRLLAAGRSKRGVARDLAMDFSTVARLARDGFAPPGQRCDQCGGRVIGRCKLCDTRRAMKSPVKRAA